MASHDEIRVIRRNAVLVLFCLLGGLLAAVLIVWRTPPTYTSEADLFVTTNQAPNAGGIYDRELFAQGRVKSYVPLVTSPSVMSAVAADVGLHESPAALARRITVTAAPDTVLLTIVAHAGTPQLAKAIASSTATAFATFASQIEGSDAGTPTVDLRLIKAPELNSTAVSPKPVLDVTVGLFLGAVVGLSLAALRQRWWPGEEAERSANGNSAVTSVRRVRRSMREAADK